MSAEMQKLAADALLERGVGLKIPAPLLFRLVRKKTMTLNVRRTYLGSLIYLSDLAHLADPEPLDVGSEPEQLIKEMGSGPLSLPFDVIAENVPAVTRSVAALLLNDKWKIRLFRGWLARVLRRRCTTDQLQELVMWLFVYGRAEPFTTTTKLLTRMMMTAPRSLGQQKKRS